MHKYGIMIMSGFAAIWFVWGLSAVSPVLGPWLLFPLVISGAMMAFALRLEVRATPQVRRNTGKIVGWASGIEFVAIFIANNVLIDLGYPGFAVCATLAIVGLHFVPLAYFLQVRNYYLAGAAMAALAAAGLLIPSDQTRLLVLGLGAAALLWTTCLVAFARKSPAGALTA